MALAAGTKLGHYEIRALIGAGGMGEVYLALDTTLKREVALKVLPEAYSRDPDRLARFRREAELLASLNHPNIAAIYGVHSEGDHHCLAMELVPGETLVEQIRRGPVELKEALRITTQIADALEHAHEKPIVHRDLKPANVKITPEGQVKVLDFGLAKAFAADSASGSSPIPLMASNSPTLSRLPAGDQPPDVSPTLPGVIMGTAAYMSPEQARGKTLDKRTDVWALGCVLYEMLTGHGAFQSRARQQADTSPGAKGTPRPHGRGSDQHDVLDTVQDIIARVLQSEPDWSLLPIGTPPGIRTLLRRCLQKDAAKRLRSTADVAIVIAEFADAAPSTRPAPAATVARPSWGRRLALSAVGIAAWAMTAAVVWNMRAPVPQPVSRLTIGLPPGQHLAALDQPAIAISPDGKILVYVAVQDQSTQQLYLRPLDGFESKPIAGTEGAVSPFFSPDGQWVGFFAGGKLKKVSVNGGSAVALGNGTNPGGASWSSQGILAFQWSVGAQGLQQVSREGGTAQPLTQIAKGEIIQRWPEFLPDGKAVLYVGSPAFASWNNTQVAVQRVGTGERKNLSQGTQPRYAASGHLLYAQSGTLMAAPFDARRLTLTGAAVPALEGVMQSPVTGAVQYSVSSAGTLVYLAGALAGSQWRLVWVSRNGEEQILPAPPRAYQFPRVSPDGRRVAVSIPEQQTQVWVYDVSRDTLTRLTLEGSDNNVPVWSHDGERIAFRSNREGQAGTLFSQASDGGSGAERLTTSDDLNSASSFSPDGELLAFMQTSPETGRDIWVLTLKDYKTHPFLRTPYEDTAPKFSSDGKWLAYSSDESGRRQIYVRPYPGPGAKWPISTDGGQEPVWNPKGGELFYRSGNKMMAVDIHTQAGFSAGKPKMLFEGPYLPSVASFPYYDVSPDGHRFLMLKPVESQASAPTQINVVLSWTEELKRLVPTR